MRAKVLLFITGQLAVSAGAGLLAARAGAPVGSPVRVLVLAVAFSAVSRIDMHLEFRRNQMTLTLAEAVVVIAFFTVGPVGAGVAAGLGELLWRAARRMPMERVAFNAANHACAVTVAAAVFWLAGRHDADQLTSWFAALGAAMCFSVVNYVSLAALLAVIERRPFRKMLVESAVSGFVITMAAAPLGLIALDLFHHGRLGPLLLVPLVVAVVANSRHAARQRDEHLRFERLYEAASRTARLVGFEDAMRAMAAEARGLVTAAWAVCCAQDLDGEWVGVLVGDNGSWTARAETVEALVTLSFGLPDREVQLDDLDASLRGFLPDASTVVLAASTEGSAAEVVLALFRDASADGTPESRIETLSAFVTQAALSIGNARLYDEVEEALQHQVDLNRQKGDFVAAVSHELRTPLTAMLGSVQTLGRLDARLDDDRRRQLLTMATDQGKRLKRLIEELLLVAAAEDAGVECTREAVDVRSLLLDVRAELQDATAGRVVLEVGPGPMTMVTDRLRLQQILLNLVENAGKYAPDGPIEVKALVKGDHTVLSVVDHGPGIAPADQERVFERFVQLDQSSTRRNGGTGLGLYLCRQLAELLGGRLDLTTADDGGCCFTLRLPTGAMAGAPATDPMLQTLEILEKP